MQNRRDGLKATAEDFKQLEQLFIEMQDLLVMKEEKNSFEVLVEIEQLLENYRLRQSFSSQEMETHYAAKLESLS
ncbi:hypothetical protein ACRW9N_02850 [Listeria aquatica]|uniref:Uncharacterized protein n=2 Tax=Listeria aquatica TaxID=1494960 RepID=W7B7K5_9LIST|nr:hypothetical protein [Listeria aquatica]EUJ21882.1 hypothetical protein MAQA_00795 [Listeria aquatica FSL S10-1188]MBC1521488.1 hypothetical protein [Listeria aquatica]